MATNTTHATSQASVSESNRSRIVKHLYHNGISSRAQIAKALELTPAAITKITARLIEAGMIEETGDLEGSKNRRSIGLKLDTTRFRIIGIKFARSLVQIGVFDLCGNTLSFENLPTVYDNTINDTIVTIHQRVEQLLDNDPSIVAIGMAVPGPYLRNVGRTAVVSSMQGWRKINFIDEFATAFRVPVFIEQDARAGALAHYLFDPSVHADDNLAYYLVGEGVGLGVIDNGRLINGFLGAATEIGHISIDVNGRPCDCGNVGCLERYCSTPRHSRYAHRRWHRGSRRSRYDPHRSRPRPVRQSRRRRRSGNRHCPRSRPIRRLRMRHHLQWIQSRAHHHRRHRVRSRPDTAR